MPLTQEESIEIIQKACDIINDDGSISGIDNIRMFYFYTKLLYAGLDWNRYKGIDSISQEKLISIIKGAIWTLKKSRNDPRLRSVFNQEIDNMIAQLHEVGHGFVFFVNVSLPEDWDFGKINIGGYDVEWVPYNEFKRSRLYFHSFEPKTIKVFKEIYKLTVTSKDLQRYSVVSLHVSGCDYEYCENKACEVYDKLLGLINLAIHHHRTHRVYALDQIYSFSELTGMNILFPYKEEAFLQEGAILQYSVYKPFKLKDEQITRLKKFQEKIREFDKRYDVLDDVYSYLSLYQGAMKTPNIDSRFLYFWETIELFLRKEVEDGYSVIIERAKCLFNHNWMMKRYLEHLKGQRNDMVHRGTARLDQEDIDTIKAVSEAIFEYYLYNEHRFALKPYLFDVFDLMNNDRADLQEKREIINKILREGICRD